MVPYLSRMAVMIKADQKAAIITGNYEMSYICGLFCRLTGIVIPDAGSAASLREETLAQLQTYVPDDEREVNLMRMLKLYKPDEIYDEQVKELFHMGMEEKNIWKR